MAKKTNEMVMIETIDNLKKYLEEYNVVNNQQIVNEVLKESLKDSVIRYSIGAERKATSIQLWEPPKSGKSQTLYHIYFHLKPGSTDTWVFQTLKTKQSVQISQITVKLERYENL